VNRVLKKILKKVRQFFNMIDENTPLIELFKHDRGEAFILGVAVGVVFTVGFMFRTFYFQGEITDNRLQGEIDVDGASLNVDGSAKIRIKGLIMNVVVYENSLRDVENFQEVYKGGENDWLSENLT